MIVVSLQFGKSMIDSHAEMHAQKPVRPQDFRKIIPPVVDNLDMFTILYIVSMKMKPIDSQ